MREPAGCVKTVILAEKLGPLIDWYVRQVVWA